MKPRIALVDDDQNILTSVTMALEAEGFAVAAFTDGGDALDSLLKDPADLAILDVKMPRMDGLELLRRLREKSQMPVVFLTSMDEEIDQFLGLRMGADDYITKPFSQRLLVERIRSILRREKSRATAEGGAAALHGDVSLDDDRQICLWKGKKTDFTVTEYLIVKALAESPGHIKSRAQLVEIAYGPGVSVDDRAVDTHMKRIRRKFKDADPAFDRIETVYGIGYRFRND